MKRCFLAVLAAIALLVSAVSAAASTPPPDSYSSYRDIPGVSAEQIDAVESLRAQGRSFSYGMALSSEAFRRKDGSLGGYARLICLRMSELFGMQFDLQLYDWADLTERFEEGSLDFTGELTSTPEHRARFPMTDDPIARRIVRSYRLPDSDALDVIALEREPRLIFIDGSVVQELVAEVTEGPFRAVGAESPEEALELLAAGQGDAFVTDRSGIGLFVDHEIELIEETYYPVVYRTVCLAAASEELAPIIEIVQLYMDAVGEPAIAQLYLEGERESLRNSLRLQLSDEELAYLERMQQSGRPISLAAEHDNYPISFYHEEGYRGVAIDVLDEIGDLTGLVFEPVDGRPDFAELLELLENHEAELLTDLVHTQEKTDRFLWSEEPYTVDRFAMLSLAGRETASFYQILTSRVGVVDQTVYQELFAEWFPGHTGTVVYDHSDEVFDALERGEIDLMMGSRNLLLSMTNYRERPGFEVNLVFDRAMESRFGFNEEEVLLASIVSKAQRLVDTDAISDRWARKGFDYRDKMAQMQIPYLTAMFTMMGSILLLVFVLYLRNRNMTKKLEDTVRQRTQELEVQTQAAQVASQAKGDFLSRMSHEIRTPLNAVMGMAQIARRSDNLPNTAKGQLDEILKASGHLLGILNDVLDMSKIEAGKMALISEPFNLFTALNEVVSIFHPRCEEKEIAFHTNYLSLEHLHVLGDKLHLKQVLINLLGNAVKFTPEGGRVDFLIETAELSDSETSVSFLIRDSGIGMTEEQQAKLFVAFEQADNTIAARFGGSGLGLTISQYLVHLMGGEIAIDSAPGEGSAFSFTAVFPKVDAEETAKPTPEALESELALNLSGRRILLAEDIEINRMILIELLEDTGLTIDQAEDGQVAVDIFAASPAGHYSLIFMDVQMPNMNGYEATRAIRVLPRPDAATIPIIAMTANAYNDDIAKERDAGMNGHLSKPIDIVAVKQLLADRLAGQEADSASGKA